ncbi:hypothetical protein [Clostridium sp.]|uniref:hypothetical protein n=1 Tax=Clostridium sp. TaxID=1506 RepID=UPI001B41DD79|nr:hypothetical protein [Clostridium sp.]MBP3916694.1 hypothetical protein [Clostridium sp.]
MFIAIKNSPYQGVYRKTEFKNEWRAPGVSIKEFRDGKLEEALKWAEVTEVKGLAQDEVSIRKKRDKNKNKNNMDIIMGIKGLNLKSVKSLESMLLEIEDETNGFTKTPFYLSTGIYSLAIDSKADLSMIKNSILMCNKAIDYLNWTIENMERLRDILKSKEKEFDNYQSYLQWKTTADGLAYSEGIRQEIAEVVKDRDYKDQIVHFIKTYKINKNEYDKHNSRIEEIINEI